MKYWTFKHKPGKDTNEKQAKEFVEIAIKNNCALMQYEYGSQDSGMVTGNWNKVREISEGDMIFLRGDFRIYAIGRAICPRKKADIIINAQEIINNKDHGEFKSNKYVGCIHFEDAKIFYEDLSMPDDWGQRIDVQAWMFYDKNGMDAKSQDYYKEGQTEFGVIKELTTESGVYFYNQLKTNFMGKEIALLESNKNLILTGAPGTGKTFLAKQMALKILFGKDRMDLLSIEESEKLQIQLGFVQFHPSYDYTDFVEGLRPISKDGQIGFELKDGIFMGFCKNAMKTPSEKFVFIIDEINRGEISKIFGELFFSIDSGYRGEKGKVITQFSNLRENYDKHFYIPDNVYIIGTMNDIDRSVESFDFAMRRRFAWIEITAKESQVMLEDNEAWKDNENSDSMSPSIEIIEEIKKRMDSLNDAIASNNNENKGIEGLNTSFHIGAAYFLKYKLYINSDDPFVSLWDNHLRILLSEYLRGMPDSETTLLPNLKNAYELKTK